ncbi:ABC transporter substrate-binding protein [Niallia sp. JL1B1071]|uniref:ABC transporter substrate-binding protein n=1 Tax=Niallia tiangongensis TaxID=3237105 RepID=UPI0037DCA716
MINKFIFLKTKLILVSVFALSLVLAGCSTSDDGVSGTDSETKSLTFVMTSDWKTEPIEEIIVNFKEETGITVDLQLIPGGDDKLDQIIKTRLATGDSMDIFAYAGAAKAESSLQPEKNLVDLSNEPWADQIVEAVKETITYGDKLYGYPMTGVNVAGVIYNKEIFNQHNLEVPNTYDEFVKVAETLKNAGVTPLIEGGKDTWPLQLWGTGYFSNAFKEDPDVMTKINSNEIGFADVDVLVTALERHLDWYNKKFLDADTLSTTQQMAVQALLDGKAAMADNADWMLNQLIDEQPDNFDMFPYPTEDGDNWGNMGIPQTLFIPKSSENIDAAKQFLSYLGSEENLNLWYEKNKLIPSWKNVESNITEGQDVFYQLLKNNKAPVWMDGQIVASYGYYGTFVQQMLLGQKTPEDVAKELDAELQKNAKARGIEGF